MEKLSLMENINFLWNDVACLNDDNCSFIICKSMVKMPKELPAIGLLEKVEVREISREFSYEADQLTIKGDVAVAIAYETGDKNQEQIAFKVPFSGDYEGTLERSNTPQVAYVHGQAVGYDNILLETVLAIPKSSGLYREPAVILGSFSQNNVLTLDEQWPEVSQIIGTQIEYFVEDYEVGAGSILHLRGQEQVGVLYAGGNMNGERVILHQDLIPFAVDIPLTVRIEEFAQLHVGYFSLTAQIISEREIQISGYCHVRALAEAIDEPEQEPVADQFRASEAIPDQMIPSQAPIYQQPQQAIRNHHASNCNQANRSRTSRRDQLQKHMRNLDRGVQTPKCTKNIDFTQSKPGTSETMPESF